MSILDWQGPGCPKCGCTGLHACIGHFPAPWTPEDEARLENALREVFKQEKEANLND